MSTTLTNGLKLPDKGSVDWYADMQNNYTILDGAVGTIADHTTAIAGKAASSHTHTKSDVTDLLNSNFIPSANNSYDLGSSSYQWKTLNGINPGALSLPTLNYTNTSKYMDISGGLSTTGSDNWYTPAVDGWIFMIIRDSPTFANILVFVTPRGATPAQFIAGAGGVLEPSSNTLWCGCPAPAGSRVRIRIKNGTIEQAVFVTCQGNV